MHRPRRPQQQQEILQLQQNVRWLTEPADQTSARLAESTQTASRRDRLRDDAGDEGAGRPDFRVFD